MRLQKCCRDVRKHGTHSVRRDGATTAVRLSLAHRGARSEVWGRYKGAKAVTTVRAFMGPSLALAQYPSSPQPIMSCPALPCPALPCPGLSPARSSSAPTSATTSPCARRPLSSLRTWSTRWGRGEGSEAEVRACNVGTTCADGSFGLTLEWYTV